VDESSVRLGKPSWSLSQLGLRASDSSTDVVDDSNIDYLANLAKIDLTRRVKRQEIIEDVNMILRCSKALVSKHDDLHPLALS
jgi:hypothetical protein